MGGLGTGQQTGQLETGQVAGGLARAQPTAKLNIQPDPLAKDRLGTDLLTVKLATGEQTGRLGIGRPTGWSVTDQSTDTILLFASFAMTLSIFFKAPSFS